LLFSRLRVFASSRDLASLSHPRRPPIWLITTTGFYSIVQKPWDREADTLTVRARAKGDLDALREAGLPELGEVKEDPNADYRFRAQAPRAAVARVVEAQVEAIDYDNFKSAVARRQGSARAHLYHGVWDVLYRIQSEPEVS
jgi:hypothetical protein